MENPISKKLKLTSLPGNFSIFQIDPVIGIPLWAQQGEFFSITQAADELSIVCEDKYIPDSINREKNWRVLKIEGPFNFDEIGILNSITTPLARANISLLAVSTFNTDYILIQDSHFIEVVDILKNDGHKVS
jgi:hypothetical protein